MRLRTHGAARSTEARARQVQQGSRRHLGQEARSPGAARDTARPPHRTVTSCYLPQCCSQRKVVHNAGRCAMQGGCAHAPVTTVPKRPALNSHTASALVAVAWSPSIARFSESATNATAGGEATSAPNCHTKQNLGRVPFEKLERRHRAPCNQSASAQARRGTHQTWRKNAVVRGTWDEPRLAAISKRQARGKKRASYARYEKRTRESEASGMHLGSLQSASAKAEAGRGTRQR